jgi:redox-sensitive bicupin YhaK (pirin superfamily)
MQIRRSNERGHANHGWLDSHHTFSFADYHDPKHMGYRALRVINEDRVAPGQGFGTHGHRDMEIISYVLEGAIAHKDSMGNGETLRPGEIQRMTAGTGVSHSEFNPSKSEGLHFLQIWIVPERPGLVPGYEQKAIAPEPGKLTLIGSREGGEGQVRIHQDVRLYAGRFGAGQSAGHEVAAGRHAWIHVVRGELEVAGTKLGAGDAAAIDEAGPVRLAGVDNAEVLVFDLA